jgi:putative oxidoreductase
MTTHITTPGPETRATRPGVELGRAHGATRYLVPLGRFLFTAIFLLSALGLFAPPSAAYAASEGVPLANVLVPIAGVLALVGGLSVLLGVRARIGAFLLVLFLVPVTLWMHRFWAAGDPMMARMQQAHFMKNIAMLGAALMVMYFGAGPLSFDARREHGERGHREPGFGPAGDRRAHRDAKSL